MIAVVHDSPQSVSLLSPGFFLRFQLLDLVNINVYTTFHQNILYCWRPIADSALFRSVKIDIWQAHWIDLVGINLCENYQSNAKV